MELGNSVERSVIHVGALILSSLEIPFTSTFAHSILSVMKLSDGVKYGFRKPMHPCALSGRIMTLNIITKTVH